MKHLRRVMVAKRDGSQEPFELQKLRRSLAAAMKGCRYDERYAGPLAEAVAMHVNECSQRRRPSTDYVYRCARTVLKETGLQDVAEAYSSYRRQRAARRRGISVLVEVDGKMTQRAWRKDSVVRVLRQKHGLSRPLGRILAGEVEKRVLELNYDAISQVLVGELIRSELLAWGLIDEQDVPLSAGRAIPSVTSTGTTPSATPEEQRSDAVNGSARPGEA